MKKNLNPLYYLEEAIGGSTARRLIKTANVHGRGLSGPNGLYRRFNSGVVPSVHGRAINDRLAAMELGSRRLSRKMKDIENGRYAKHSWRKFIDSQKGGSKLDKSI